MTVKLVSALICGVALTSCDAVPRDNYGTTERIRQEAVLRAGAAANPPWVIVDGTGVSGPEARLVETFAQRLGARVEWRTGSQLELAEGLHAKEFDLLAAGLDRKTPLASKVALTQAWATTRDPRSGSKEKRALAVVQGESRLLFELDRFLQESQEARQVRAVAEQP